MFRPVRKKANEISVEEAKKLLHEARRGVLAVSGDDGYPYAVPINYLYDEDAQEIIFHAPRSATRWMRSREATRSASLCTATRPSKRTRPGPRF